MELLLQGKKKLLTYGKYLLRWFGSFIVVLGVVKLAFLIPDALIYKDDRSTQERIQAIFLAQEKTSPVLLAQATSGAVVAAAPICSLTAEGLSSPDQLYDELKPIVGDAYSEDVGRYVGYGRK